MIAYLLLTHISRMFSSMPGLAGGIARDIREGTLKRYLIQPVDMIGYLLSYRVAHKVAYIATSALPYGILFFVCRGFFDGLPDPMTLAAYAVSLVLAFLIGFFFEVERRDGRVLVPGGDVAPLYRDDLELLHLGADAPARPAAAALGGVPEGAAVPVHGVFPGGGVPGQGPGDWRWSGTCWASWPGRSPSCVLARGLYRLGLRRYSAYGG